MSVARRAAAGAPRRAALALLACTAVAAAEPPRGWQPAARPRITGISHAAFRVSDPAAARTFYHQLLGLPLAAPPSADRATYAIGHRQSLVIQPGLRPEDDERLLHLAFDTPDLPALQAHLAARGVKVSPDASCREGAIRVTDPEGHTIEFVQSSWPPPARGTASGAALSTRLLHAGLIVADEARAQAFYRDTLGFTELWRGGRPPGTINWVNMRVPDGTDYIEYMLVSSPPDRRQRGVHHHLALLVADMQTAWEEVGRRSASLERPLTAAPQVGVNGRYQLNLFDPDGTRTELMEPFTVR